MRLLPVLINSRNQKYDFILPALPLRHNEVYSGSDCLRYFLRHDFHRCTDLVVPQGQKHQPQILFRYVESTDCADRRARFSFFHHAVCQNALIFSDLIYKSTNSSFS
jgi:hypothetical protein